MISAVLCTLMVLRILVCIAALTLVFAFIPVSPITWWLGLIFALWFIHASEGWIKHGSLFLSSLVHRRRM